MPQDFANIVSNFLFISQKNRLKYNFLRLFLFFLILMPVVFLGIMRYIQLNEELTNTALTRRQALAELSSKIVEERFTRLTDIGISLSTRINMRKAIEEGKWNDAIKFLETVPKDLPLIERVVLIDPKGTLMSDTPHSPNVIGQNFAYRDWYVGVSKNWEPYVSGIYKRASIPQYNIIAEAIPIKSENGEVIGIMLLQVKLDTLLEWSRNINVGGSGYVYFVDKAGNIAGHPNYDPQGEIINWSEDPLTRKVLKGVSGIEIAKQTDSDPKKYVSAYEPVEKFGWAAVVTQPESEVFAARNAALISTLITFSIILVLDSFLAILIIHIISTLNFFRQKERVFLESIGDGVFVIDKNWNITLWNEAAEIITGWSKAEVIGKQFRTYVKLIRERDRQEEIGFVEQALLYGKKAFISENILLITKDRKEISIDDSASPVFNQYGEVDGAIVIFRDITKEKKIQSIRSDFAYASHHLDTPVTKALWNLETAMGEKDLKQIKERIKTTQNSIKAISKLIDELITISAIEQNLIFARLEDTDILKDVIESSINAIDSKHTKPLNKEIIAPKEPIKFRVDCRLLEKAITEILENALLYSKGNELVKIEVIKEEYEVIIKISNTGIGIPLEQHPQVFTKFFRGSNTDKETMPGAGLGLYIAKSYIENINGKIWFSSKEDEGATFNISVPLQK